MLKSIENRSAIATLILIQFVCAINWYSVSSVFALIAADLHQNVSGLGLVTATFVLGVAGFQIPAGLIAARYGPKRTLTIGLLLISSSAILTGFVDQVAALTILRLIEGVGEAFIFGPGVILVMRYFRKGSEGLGIGLFGAAFDTGGIVGISGWAVLGSAVGWRLSVSAGGALALVACVVLVLVVPNDPPGVSVSLKLSELKGIMLNKWLLLVSAGLLVSQVTFGVNSYFMVYYLEESLRSVAVVAGAVSGATLVASILVSPYVGRALDRSPNPKKVLIVFCFISAGGLAMAAVASVYAALLSGIVVGAASCGAWVFGLGIGRKIGGARREYEALWFSWLSTIAFVGGVLGPLVFSSIAAGFGYQLAWLLTGALLAGVTLPVFALRSEPAKS